MSRKAIVSRTVIGIKVSALVLNVETAEPSTQTYVLSGSFKGKDEQYDEKKVLKAVKAAYEDDVIKVCKVTSIEECNTLYGMWEQDFIQNAMILDPVTRKPVGMDSDDIEIAE